MCCFHQMLAPVVWNSKQTTLHSRAHCRITQPLTVKSPEMSILFKRKKASSIIPTGLVREWIPREMRGNRDHLQGSSLLLFSFSILKCASILNLFPSTLNNTDALHLRGSRAHAHGTRRTGVWTLEPGCLGACPLQISCDRKQVT